MRAPRRRASAGPQPPSKLSRTYGSRPFLSIPSRDPSGPSGVSTYKATYINPEALMPCFLFDEWRNCRHHASMGHANPITIPTPPGG